MKSNGWVAGRLGGIALIASSLVGCDAVPTTVAGGAVRDSAGVRLVVYDATPAPTQSIVFPAQPAYRHGSADGDYLFGYIAEGRLLPDGGAVVSAGMGAEVLLIGADGRRHQVIASPGQGPGEVRDVRSVLSLGRDTVLVEDDGNSKVLVFVGSEPADEIRLSGDFSTGAALRTEGVDPDGRLLMTTSGFMPGFEADWLRGHMVRLGLSTLLADTVASYDLVPKSPPGGPYDPFNARGFAIVSAHRFVVGRTDVAEIVWRASDGTLEQIVRWKPDRRRPTAEDLDAFASRLLVDMRRVNPRMSAEQVDAMVTSQLESFAIRADTPLPVFGGAHGDGEGGVWLADYTTAGEVERYHIIGADGVWRGTAVAPSRFRLLDVLGHRALGTVKDELDVETVVMYELEITDLGS